MLIFPIKQSQPRPNLSKAFMVPERLPNESWEQYKYRRRFAQFAVEQYMKGKKR